MSSGRTGQMGTVQPSRKMAGSGRALREEKQCGAMKHPDIFCPTACVELLSTGAQQRAMSLLRESLFSSVLRIEEALLVHLLLVDCTARGAEGRRSVQRQSA